MGWFSSCCHWAGHRQCAGGSGAWTGKLFSLVCHQVLGWREKSEWTEERVEQWRVRPRAKGEVCWKAWERISRGWGDERLKIEGGMRTHFTSRMQPAGLVQVGWGDTFFSLKVLLSSSFLPSSCSEIYSPPHQRFLALSPFFFFLDHQSFFYLDEISIAGEPSF